MNDMHAALANANLEDASATAPVSVVVEREFAHPPEKLWRALTQPHLIEAWLMKNDFQPVRGHSFKLSKTPQPGFDIVIDCQVLEIEPGQRLSYTWDYPNDNAAFNLKSVVTFTLTPTASGTHLRMEQKGFRPDQKQAIQGANYGWQGFFQSLDQLLAQNT